MKVAIPMFGERIAPRFDCAEGFLVVETENGEIVSRKELPVGHFTPFDRIRVLSQLGINTLICSGIDGFCARQLAFHGLKVYSSITGEAEDALRSFLDGTLESGLMIGAGAN